MPRYLGPDLGSTPLGPSPSPSPNFLMIELSVMLGDRVEDLIHTYENTPCWRWLRRRDLRTTINSVGIVQHAVNVAGHTYKMED